jgi:hypothetical protein
MAPIGTLESTLPGLLAALSDTGQAVLADHMGFCLAIAGYPSDTGEALAAVGADILSVAERQAQALSRLGEHLLDGWGNVDAAGISGLSFWPIHIGRTRLALTVSGRPRFNQRAFAELVGALRPLRQGLSLHAAMRPEPIPHARHTGRRPVPRIPGPRQPKTNATQAPKPPSTLLASLPELLGQQCPHFLSRESTAECSKKSPSFAAWARENCSAAAA